MRSSQGAATSDLAVHRTLRMGFSSRAAAACRGAALGRRGAIHALSRRRVRGCPRVFAATDAQEERQTASTRMNTRRRMFLKAGTDGGQRGQRRHELGSVKWNPDLDDWTPPQRRPAACTKAIENTRQRPLSCLKDTLYKY